MLNIVASIDIHRPPTEVFEFITSSPNDPAWQHGTLASSRLFKGAAAPGGAFRTVGHLMGRRMVSTFEITEFEPNRKYGFRSLTGSLISHTLCTLKGTEGRTRIKIVTRASSRNESAMPESGLEQYMPKELKGNLAVLKTLLEQAPASQEPVLSASA